jgi:hypothetical protein
VPKISKNLLNLSLPVFLYYILNYLIAIFLKNKIGFENYGKIGAILSYSALFQSYIMFGMNNGVDLIILRNENWTKFIKQIQFVTIFLSGLSLVTLFFLKKINTLTLLGLLHCLFFLFLGLYKLKLSSSSLYKENAKIQYINIIVSSLLTFIVYYFTNNYKARVVILIISDFSILFYFFKKDFQDINYFLKKNNFDFKIYPNFKFYFFLVLHGIFTFFYTNYDRVYLANNSSFTDLGRYWFYMQLSLPILVFGEVLVRYKISDIFNYDFANFIEKHKRKIIIIFLFFLLSIYPLLSSNLNFIIFIFLGQIMNAMYLPLSAFLLSKEKSFNNLLITILIAILQFFLFYFYMPKNLIIISKIFFFLSIFRVFVYSLFLINTIKKTAI